MKQPTLFEMGTPDMKPIDPNVRPEDVQRLTGQNLRILEALQAGPKTAYQLCAIALKYTSRISDIRAAGYVIDFRKREGKEDAYFLVEN